MKMKLKKTLRAVSAAAVGAGAIMVLGLAGQSLALAQSGPSGQGQMLPPYSDADFNNGASDVAGFAADIGVLCGASQPFTDASDPSWNCGDTTRTYP